MWTSTEALRLVAGIFHHEARRQEHNDATRRASAWKTWAAVTAMADGARLGHRWTKPVPPWVESKFTESGALETTQEAVHRQAGTWQKLWALDSQSPLDWGGMSEADDPLVPDIDELREVSRTFSRFTALGIDDFHPGHIGSLCDSGVSAFLASLRAMLRLRALPKVIELLLIILLPKPDGGTRPIGFFPSCIRVYARWARRIYAVPWELANKREYWFGDKGRTCDMCSWRQSLVGEYAAATNQHAVSALVDLHKAYEHVTHE